MSAAFEQLLSYTVVFTVGVVVASALAAVVKHVGGAQLAYTAWAWVPLLLLWHCASAWLPQGSLPSPLPSPAALGIAGPAAAVVASDTGAVWQMALLSAWGVGVLAFAWRLVAAQMSFVRQLGALEVHSGALVFTSAHAHTGPVLLGLFAPRIVLPNGFFETFTPTEQHLVLAHEHTHLQRADLWANALAAALQCLMWFNPLAHWAASNMRRDQELACDAAVLAQNGQQAAAAYAQALLKTQSFSQPGSRSPFVCQWQSRHPLKDRIMQLQRPQPRRVQKFASIATLLCAGLLAGYGVSANPAATASAASQPPAKPGAGQYRIEVEYNAEWPGANGKSTQQAKFAMITDSGKPAGFSNLSPTGKGCAGTITVTPTPGDAEKVTVLMPMSCNGKDSAPKFITKLGAKSSIEMGEDVGGKGKQMFKFGMVVTQ